MGRRNKHLGGRIGQGCQPKGDDPTRSGGRRRSVVWDRGEVEVSLVKAFSHYACERMIDAILVIVMHRNPAMTLGMLLGECYHPMKEIPQKHNYSVIFVTTTKNQSNNKGTTDSTDTMRRQTALHSSV